VLYSRRPRGDGANTWRGHEGLLELGPLVSTNILCSLTPYCRVFLSSPGVFHSAKCTTTDIASSCDSYTWRTLTPGHRVSQPKGVGPSRAIPYHVGLRGVQHGYSLLPNHPSPMKIFPLWPTVIMLPAVAAICYRCCLLPLRNVKSWDLLPAIHNASRSCCLLSRNVRSGPVTCDSRR